jgi:hypothetical protein
VEALKERADNGELVEYGLQEDGLGTDVHVVSGFVKAFLRELPDPVIPFSQVLPHNSCQGAEFLQVGKKDNVTVDDLRPLVQRLPEPNRNLLHLLLSLCAQIVQHQDKNLMSPGNLGFLSS